MATPVDFPKYLQSLIKSYESQPDLYTLTDLQVEVRVEISPEDRSPETPKNKPETKIDRLEVLSGIRKYLRDGNVLLVGKPGSGKSTVLQRFRWELAREALKDGGPIPILVQLRSDRSIEQAICAEFRQAKLRVSPEDVDDLLLDGKLLLLLDGVNEMPSKQRRDEFQLFRDDNSDTPMILTTRDLALGGSLGIEKQLEMCALTKPQMEEFVHKHLPQHGDSLLRQLRDRLREIAETPLLLWMMCEVFEPTLKIPQSKGELFDQFHYKYEKFKGNIPVSEDSRRFKSELLQQLAFVMLQGDLQQPTEGFVAISRDRAEEILERWLHHRGVLDAPTKAKEWLEDLLEHHLLQVAVKPEEIEFHHQLFQEYYAGRALRKLFDEKHDDVTDDKRLQHFYLNYFKWTEPLAFMLSLLADEDRAVRVVRLALDVDVMLGARLAGEVKREFQKSTVGLVDGLDVPGWLKVALLQEVRSDEAIPGLLKFVEDSDSDVRRRAVDALGAIGSEAAIHELLKLVEDADRKMRWRVADALGKIGSEAAIPALLKLLEDLDTNVRWRAADALRQIGTEAAIPELFKLVEDSNSDVRQSAANALGQIGAEAAIPALLKLAEDSDSYVRWTTAKALGKIGSKEAISGLLKLSEDSEFYVRFSVARALGNVGTDATIPGLLKLSKDLDVNVGLMAAKALEKIHDNGELPKLFKLFEDSNSDVYMTVEDELEKMGFEVSILELLKIIECSDFYVRSKAAVALGKIGSEEAISALLKLVQDSELYVRQSAADALGNIAKQHAEKVALHLPHLLTLIPSKSGKEVHRLILAIQAACKYYNYSIRQLSLTPEIGKHPANASASIYNIQSVEKLMSNEPPIFNQQNATIGVNYAAENSNPKIIQKVEAAQESSPEAALNAVVQIIQALEKKYTYVQDEQQARHIIDAEFKEIKEQKPIEWQNLISLKRLYNGGKNAAVKVGEHFAESNPWGKGIVAFIEGVSEDVN
ncbi:MAG: HEAT repeat domain-containing protein [Microcoleus sp. PH2017_29_MFU_D_A]|uniref:HEAT repeat domain-containing protein n=1 Tax=unclassified Microcoleus TaxID=2642155 RepID=UPI001DEB4837|nr:MULTISPECIES: HEAT repeat domain-containing protein [unclassified Microcoleus]MCC3602308.1 HEAT repeat domain-containing protein [Microcoleus sp. PH2017_29_MFU_D_A]MCC3633468.1 HEAT repeat domain-containing protein [Microcoleus sp. PH2017_37_MFU_D_B]